MFELTSEALILLLRLVMLAVLYLFLGAVLLGALRSLRGAPAADRPAFAAPRLVVLDPGTSSLQAGASLPLRPLTRIGRAAESTIVLDDTFVSAEHAVIARRDGAWWLSDRASTNGTLLNEQPVNGDVHLALGDVVGIGDVRLRVEP